MVHIICFGNLWHGDDGFGVHVFRRLAELGVPEHVRVFDAGTAGFNALGYFENCRKVIIVDAMESGLPAGTVRKFPWEATARPEGVLSVHAVGVDHLLALLPVLNEEMPEVVIIGAQIDHIVPFTDTLTPELEKAVETAISMIQSEALS
ncbi:MAG TPA: hydrogenase maturation protease [Pyrinomonadaceae bacterium]|nr:hydrogenase maturation protease [Pyrinomonadaceae bacterium]